MRRQRARSLRSSPKPATTAVPDWQRGLTLVIGLVAIAFAVRVLFWRATPDAAWPYSALYQGDAPLWLEYAQALRSGGIFELGLPIHPPATGYLVALLWNGEPSGFSLLRTCWAGLGALGVGLATLAALRSFGSTVAAVTGTICCFSTGLLLLSGSIDSEMPYLVLVLATLVLFEDLRAGPRAVLVASWAALHGLASLFRVEHALYFVLVLLLLGSLWHRNGRRLRTIAGGGGLALLCFGLPLVPWHAHAWRAIARFNSEEPARGPAESAALGAVEQALRELPWDQAAIQRRAALPGFCRRTASAFVAATVAVRGGTLVRGEDFGVLEEAFGAQPEPLRPCPFVSAYGPLNFALANRPGAAGGFDRGALEELPRLQGGAGRYPRALVQGLPPPQLSFDYPPHVRLFNDGYAIGWDWIRREPVAFLALATRRLGVFWRGAALGLTGYAFPQGLSGTRRAVDLATPEAGAATWMADGLLLLVCTAGVVAAGRRPGLQAWLLFALSKACVAALFFGYARLGATVIPVVAACVALAAERWLAPRRPRTRVSIVAVLCLLGIGIEAARWAHPPTIRLDGRPIGSGDAVQADLHRDQRVQVGPE